MILVPDFTVMHDWWFKLPLALKQKWWLETDYGKKKPSAELKFEIEEALK